MVSNNRVGISNVASSPFTLTSAWAKVCTTDHTTKALLVSPTGSASTFDIEWTVVPAGASAPTDTFGNAVLGGEDFLSGIPLGDIYLRSVSGQIAVVKIGG